MLIWAMLFQLDVSKVWEFVQGYKSTQLCKIRNGDLYPFISFMWENTARDTPLLPRHFPKGCSTSGVDTI